MPILPISSETHLTSEDYLVGCIELANAKETSAELELGLWTLIANHSLGWNGDITTDRNMFRGKIYLKGMLTGN